MRCRSDSRRSEAIFSWVCFQERNEAAHIAHRNRRMDGQKIGRNRCERYRRKVFVRVVGDLWMKARIDDKARGDENDGVAIRRSARRVSHASVAAPAT